MPDESLFDKNLSNPTEPISDEANKQTISDELEKDYLIKLRKKNKKNLIKLDVIERERIARYIKDLYVDVKTRQDEIADDIDRWDDTYRMKPKTMKGMDADTPNYTTPLSTVTLETIHANIMNVFFSPKDIMRILPTEKNDIPKIKKLDIFGNWSMENEMDLEYNCDRLFHSSNKNGEAPYIVSWEKEYGNEIKVEIVMNPASPSEPLLDDNDEVVTQEREVEKLLYNGPKLETFSRKDYILPSNANMEVIPDWEMRRIRINADRVKRNCLEGKYYESAFDDIGGWGQGEITSAEDRTVNPKDDQSVPLGKTEKIFVEFYGRLRVNAIKNDEEGEEVFDELEDEFIAIMEIKSETLCALRKNKFPMKFRPIGLDVFIPDDEGRMAGIGIMEFMESIQDSYDLLHNQYLFGTVQANSPAGFFSPTGNTKDEPIKIKSGYMYPTSDPQSVNFMSIKPPDNTLMNMLEMVRNFAQLLFGISDYAAGLESQIDPSAPAKKAEIVVAQGNVRMNLIIKRKNRTLKDIFKKWFLLYQANMPKNKFMRIAGEDRDNPWKFEPVNMTDFALKALPDFELTGNILNSNKTLEVQKRLSIYQVLTQNPFFMPNTQQGQEALFAITKWMIDGLDEEGLSSFLPSPQGEPLDTPEEENARFLQGDDIEVIDKDDHIYHIKKHIEMIVDPSIPEDIRKKLLKHNASHSDFLKKQITQRIVMSMTRQPQQGGLNVQGQGTPAPAGNVLQGQPGMAGFERGNPTNVS